MYRHCARCVVYDVVHGSGCVVPRSKQCDAAQSCEVDGLVAWLPAYYCASDSERGAIAFGMVVAVLYLFLFLGVLADDYLAPALTTLSEQLHLSENVAGCTLVALANGSPDLLSSFRAVQAGQLGVGVGALVGAGLFVTTVVCAAVGLSGTFIVSRTAAMRDMTFYMVATCWLLVISAAGQMTLVQGLIFVAVYVLYVVMVLKGSAVFYAVRQLGSFLLCGKLGRGRSRGHRSGYAPLLQSTTGLECAFDDSDDDDSNVEGTADTIGVGSPGWAGGEDREGGDADEGVMGMSAFEAHDSDQDEAGELELVPVAGIVGGRLYRVPKNPFTKVSYGSAFSETSDDDLENSYFKHFRLWFRHLRDVVGWRDMGTMDRVMFVLQFPIQTLSFVTIPPVEAKNWIHPLSLVYPLASSMLVMSAFGLSAGNVGNVPTTAVVALVSLCLGVVLFLSSAVAIVPKWFRFFPTLAFICGAVWIYMAAGELVAILAALGSVMHIPGALLGVTVLAWGNSLGDFISNRAVAVRGFAGIAMGACFGGPLLNILLGIGLSVTVETLASRGSYGV